jgi:hypothetical protein
MSLDKLALRAPVLFTGYYYYRLFTGREG